MYIDFEDSRPDTPRVEGALSVREGVLISIIVHLLLLIAILLLPDLLPESLRPTPVAAVTREPSQTPRFVFMQPRVDISKPQPRRDVEASDQDRRMSTIDAAAEAREPASVCARQFTRARRWRTSRRQTAAMRRSRRSRKARRQPKPRGRWRRTIRHGR